MRFRASQVRWKIFVVVLSIAVGACSSGEEGVLFRAEKKLFEADRLRTELSGDLIKSSTPFVDRTIAAYASVVDEFRAEADKSEALERIVVTAQMSLADIQFQAGRLGEARSSFVKVFDIEKTLPTARMNAMYSAAVISEFLGDPANAVRLYESFFDSYLSPETALETGSAQVRYLVTPLKLAELSRKTDNDYAEALWLQRAQALYEAIADKADDDALLREVRFDLLAALIQQSKWQEALTLADVLAAAYVDPENLAATAFLRAKIYQGGLNDRPKALAAYRQVFGRFPGSKEAPSAMLVVAGMLKTDEDVEEAVELYKRVTLEYSREETAASEAEWQLANIEQQRGNWGEASLYLKSLARKYPGTYYGFESTVRLAAGYHAIGEPETAAKTYERALDDYKEVLSSNMYGTPAKVMAEEYILQVYSALKDWPKAIEHLVQVADRYPEFPRLQHNLITAAKIFEEELDDRQSAVETLRSCVSKFPGSDAASAANKELERLGARK